MAKSGGPGWVNTLRNVTLPWDLGSPKGKAVWVTFPFFHNFCPFFRMAPCQSDYGKTQKL